MIEAADCRQLGEGRIVDHNAPFRIVGGFVVTARPEGANYLNAGERHDILGNPPQESVVNSRRCHAVVGGAFRFEFFYESVVVLKCFFAIGSFFHFVRSV